MNTLLADVWLPALGWGGSALLVYSLLQQRVLRFRTLNLVAGLVLIVFNTILGVWPMVALNAVTSAINIWFIVQLRRQRHDAASFEVIEVGLDDQYLRHVLDTHGDDIGSTSRPSPAGPPGQEAFVIVKGDETVGVVVSRVRATPPTSPGLRHSEVPRLHSGRVRRGGAATCSAAAATAA